MFDQDLSGLIIKGNPPPEAINEAWNKIFLEYNNVATGGADNPVVDKIKEIEILNSKIIFIDGAIQYLQIVYDPEIIECLKSYGFNLKIERGEDPTEKLKAISIQAKRLIIQMEIEQNELTRMQEEFAENSSTGRDVFDENLISLSNFQGYGVKASDITVSQYLKAMKRMEKYFRKQARQTA